MEKPSFKSSQRSSNLVLEANSSFSALLSYQTQQSSWPSNFNGMVPIWWLCQVILSVEQIVMDQRMFYHEQCSVNQVWLGKTSNSALLLERRAT